MAHLNLPITVEQRNGDKVEGVGFVCDCSERGVTIRVDDAYDGTMLVSLFVSHEDFKEINK